MSETPQFLPTDIALPYGLGPNGKLVSVNAVTSGLACGCTCPGCGKPLVAKKGLVIRHHFAHTSDQACVSGFESMLHLLAKDIIASDRAISVPKISVTVGATHRHVKDATVYALENVRLEQWLDGIRPDIIADVGSHQLIIEIAVTHKAEPEKIAKLTERGSPAIEIDLSEFHRREISERALRDAIHQTAPRIWLFNRLAALALPEVGIEEEARIETERLREARKAEERASLASEWARWCEEDVERLEREERQLEAEKRAHDARLDQSKGRVLVTAQDVLGGGPALAWVEKAATHYASLRGGWRSMDFSDFEVWCDEKLRRESVALQSIETAHRVTREQVLRAALAKLKDRDKANLWMTTTNPKIGGKPFDICVTPNGLDLCKGALR